MPPVDVLEYGRNERWRFRRWGRWVIGLCVLASLVVTWQLVPRGWGGSGHVCLVCGKLKLERSFYVGDIAVWTQVENDPGDSGRDYDRLIGAPHAHDWSRMYYRTPCYPCPDWTDAPKRLPAIALKWVDQHLRDLPIEERREVYRRMFMGRHTVRDVRAAFEDELYALRARGKLK